MKKQIPNIFTLLNLVSGCLAIVFIMQTESFNITEIDENTNSISLPEKIVWGSIFIFISAIIDFLDGFVARALNATSTLGAQLDSLSDVVSFGVAPSLILYQLLRMCYLTSGNSMEISIWVLLPAFIFACAGAYRLGRYNIAEASYHFKGTPIPSAGLFVASLPLILHYNYFNGVINELLFNKWVLYVITLLLSYLMISNIPVIGMKFTDYKLKSNMPRVILVIISIIAVVILKWAAAPIIFIAYIIVSVIYKNKLKTQDTQHKTLNSKL
jgi:CDP-diacylglycerol---serine O-phosphatidyltransferase